MWHNLNAKFCTVSHWLILFIFFRVWYGLVIVKISNQYAVCINYKVNSFCSWYWAWVGSSEEEDGRFGGRSILSFIKIFIVLLIFICIFNQDPQAFGSESAPVAMNHLCLIAYHHRYGTFTGLAGLCRILDFRLYTIKSACYFQKIYQSSKQKIREIAGGAKSAKSFSLPSSRSVELIFCAFIYILHSF